MGAPRVLIVDDEVMLRSLFGRVLERESIAYRTASSASSALDALEQQSYALVLLDRRLGTESGLDLLRHIRAAAPHRDTRVVVVSGDPVDGADATEAGADGYLTKPVSIDDLLACVRAQLQHYDDTRGAPP
jgi:two-component system response regulator PilR (NtrC family)